MEQQLDQSHKQTNDGYPTRTLRPTQTSASAFRRLLYCATLTLLIVLVASSFEPALATTFYVLAAGSVALCFWRFVISRHKVSG